MSLSDWSKRAGLLIAEALGASYAALVFGVQARHECADGDTSISLGARYNNPLNLDDRDGAGNIIFWGGRIGEYLGRFASFDTIEDGATACAVNYRNGPYADVLLALTDANFDPLALARAIQNSPWDADHYGYHLEEEVRQELAVDPNLVTQQQFQDYKDALQKELDENYVRKDDPQPALPAHSHKGEVTVT